MKSTIDFISEFRKQFFIRLFKKYIIKQFPIHYSAIYFFSGNVKLRFSFLIFVIFFKKKKNYEITFALHFDINHTDWQKGSSRTFLFGLTPYREDSLVLEKDAWVIWASVHYSILHIKRRAQYYFLPKVGCKCRNKYLSWKKKLLFLYFCFYISNYLSLFYWFFFVVIKKGSLRVKEINSLFKKLRQNLVTDFFK